jgi:hypothetical protein
MECDVVDHEQATFLNVWIEVEVLKIRERVSVRAVKQYGLQARGKRVNRQSLLGRAIHEFCDLTVQQRIVKNRGNTLISIDSEYRVRLAQM